MRHGHSGAVHVSPTYQSWRAMIQRVRPGTADSAYYADRGITVCDRWRKFENFLADMGERPAGKTIDRINNNGNYEPGNCRWATREQQTQNTRTPRTNKSGAKGVSYHKHSGKWSANIRIQGRPAHLGLFNTVAEASAAYAVAAQIRSEACRP